jgi:hypothetical protein
MPSFNLPNRDPIRAGSNRGNLYLIVALRGKIKAVRWFYINERMEAEYPREGFLVCSPISDLRCNQIVTLPMLGPGAAPLGTPGLEPMVLGRVTAWQSRKSPELI